MKKHLVKRYKLSKWGKDKDTRIEAIKEYREKVNTKHLTTMNFVDNAKIHIDK